TAHIMRTAVIVRGCVQAYAVIAPVETASEFIDRHQLDHGYAQLGEDAELADRGEKRALVRESPNMDFINDLAFSLRSAPWMTPMEGARIHDLGGRVRSARLKARRRIGTCEIRVIELKLIKGARAHARHHRRKITIGLRFECRGRSVDDNVHVL